MEEVSLQISLTNKITRFTFVENTDFKNIFPFPYYIKVHVLYKPKEEKIDKWTSTYLRANYFL